MVNQLVEYSIARKWNYWIQLTYNYADIERDRSLSDGFHIMTKRDAKKPICHYFDLNISQKVKELIWTISNF